MFGRGLPDLLPIESSASNPADAIITGFLWEFCLQDDD
jgi:hypothetical protein